MRGRIRTEDLMSAVERMKDGGEGRRMDEVLH